MEKLTSCAVCGSKSQREVFNGPDEFLQRRGMRIKIRYVLCGGCSLVYANPRMTDAELSDVYDAEYWKTDAAYEKVGGSWRLKPPFVEDRLRVAAERLHLLETRGILRRFKKGSSALEVGSSAGFLLSTLKRAGWKVQGVEPTPLARFAERVGLPTKQAFFDESVLRGRTYDLIGLMHVFEHLKDPVAFLRSLKGSLAKGGLLWLELPDLACPRPIDLSHPHLYFYSANSITATLAKAGFKVRLLETYHSRNGAYQVLHVFAEVGKPDKPRKDSAKEVKATLDDAWALHRRKQAIGPLVKAYAKVGLASLEKP